MHIIVVLAVIVLLTYRIWAVLQQLKEIKHGNDGVQCNQRYTSNIVIRSIPKMGILLGSKYVSREHEDNEGR